MWGGPQDLPAWDLTRAPLRLVQARSFRQRLLGLHAWKAWGAFPRGLLFPSCRMVHTLGLTCPINVLFLDDQGRILRRITWLAPGRWARCAGAYATLELPPNNDTILQWQAVITQAWSADVSLARNVVA
ncbi:MAG: hypothetical protein WA968_03320 [Castellaniella sp.]|jgi:uncharacterized membrane protein (UPF0127 family)